MYVPLQIISVSPPAAKDTGDVLFHHGQVPRVPVDVFHEIVPHVDFEDHLSISLLSKDFYAALPPRRTHLVLSSTRQLTSFAGYVSDDPARASALRSLHILINDLIPSENPSELLVAQKSTLPILEHANQLEELSCRGPASNDLLPESLTMCRRLLRFELERLSPNITGERIREHFFPLSLRSFHFTCPDISIISPQSAVDILGLASQLPSLDTIIVDNYVYYMFMMSVDNPPSIQPTVRTLQLVDSPRSRVHPAFVWKLSQRQGFPNLTTLHFNGTFPPQSRSGCSVEHLILTDTPDQHRLESDLGLWQARRVTYVRGPDSQSDTHSIRSAFSLSPHHWVDLRIVVCLSISAPTIAPEIWADLVTSARDVRLLELESSTTTFADLVEPLVRICISDPFALSLHTLTPSLTSRRSTAVRQIGIVSLQMLR